jgi:hypothetical protein
MPKLTEQEKRDRAEEDRANLREWRILNGLCTECGKPLMFDWPEHRCSVSPK